MKLLEKGHFAPRPALDGAAEAVACTIDRWPSVVARTHWQLGDESVVDGADFYVGDRELGHLHLYPEAHVRVSRALRAALLSARLARPFRWSESFVVHGVGTLGEAHGTAWLFRLAYDELEGADLASLVGRVHERTRAASSAA